ncbi:MAG: chemotaxis protein CheC [Symploca sp. SIO3E6]|nr:chemotaxis protein CheC [Caldora sp. SIO3E6]
MNLTTDQLDAVKELINIGVGQAAGMLNEMIEFHIRLQIPVVKFLSPKLLQKELGERIGCEQLSTVKLDFGGSFVGTAELVFPTESAATLVAVLTGEEPGSPDLDSLKIGTLSEVGNILLNGVMGSISNMLDQPLKYAVPSYTEDTIDNLLPFKNNHDQATVLLAEARFDIEELQLQGDIVLFFDVGSFEVLLEAIELV